MSGTKADGLKRTAAKGAPPARGEGIDPIKTDTRSSVKKQPLQFMVTEDEFEEFSAAAVEKFGHTRGAKTKYFNYLRSLAHK